MTTFILNIGFGCLVFLVLQQVATGLNCYSCLSCSGNSFNTVSSTSSNESCYKYVYSSSIISSYTNRGVRASCSEGSDNLGGTYYCCSTDLCNGNVSLSSSLGLAFALVTALGILKAMVNN